MPNDYFQFKQFTIYQRGAAMKVGTDSVLLGAWANVSEKTAILDVGTGSGILAIMLAQRNASACIDAVEIDESSFTQAVENVTRSPWSDRIRLYSQPFQQFVEKSVYMYDLIVSNPPFFNRSLLSPDGRKNLARHTDSLSQEDLLSGTVKLLKPNGVLSVVLPVAEGELFVSKAAEYNLFCHRKTTVKPNPDKPPKRLLLEFSRSRRGMVESELCVEEGVRHAYTAAYVNLTKDFYLNF